jgi:KAP family P-loop domain
MDDQNLTPEEIWKGDLLGRKSEAELLIAYIESVSQQRNFREDAMAFTIAVDAGYGEGKTYFLKRLAKQLSINHPVAFVDAWRDDLADEPLTALAATLKKALAPYMDKEPVVRKKFQTVLEKTGGVVKIVAKGLAKRGLGLLITNEAVGTAEAIIEGSSEAIQSAVNDGLKDGSQEIVDSAALIIEKTPSRQLMERRIADFEAGQEAIDELKASLSDLVASLNEVNIHSPIVIVIDELDRCRPTYAVKLLEEVKHLFDIPGIVFLFGIHTGQLAHSVNAAYGPGFDGRAYLSRFIHRHYRLAQVSLSPFVRHLIERSGISVDRLWFPHVASNGNMTTSDIITFYFRRYNLGARDAISIVETLQTSCALTKNVEFLMPLLLPMLIARLKGSARGQILGPENNDEQLIFNVNFVHTSNSERVDWYGFLGQLHGLATLSDSDLSKHVNDNPESNPVQLFAAFRNDAQAARVPLAHPSRYRDLLETVGRFGKQDSSDSTT